jgi:glyoxylase-like metal-dependent hydrolase (beta-lactamase superfamily II)/rhodanese-related sulfurtransferase
MGLKTFSADDLFDWLLKKKEFLLLDVRNEVEFGRFKVEGPFPFEMLNVPYMEFIEHEDESVAKVPTGKKIRIVCAKEGSAKYVGEILENHGHADIEYLLQGIKSWGNLLSPIRVDNTSQYELFQFRRPGKASCSYGLIYKKEMMVFDPAKNIAAYQTFANQRGCKIVKTFETHRQADYISGSQLLNQTVGSQIMVPESDFKEAVFPYFPVKNGETFKFKNGGPQIKAIHTPGHTPGSMSYLVDGKYLISGDTVFIYSIGRPDLGGMAEEWSKLLFRTMSDIILRLDDSINVLPGHYISWKEANEHMFFMASLKKVKENNSEIFSIKDEKEFFEFIKENIRPQPQEYVKIRKINAGLLQVNEEQQDILDLGKNECAASRMQQD